MCFASTPLTYGGLKTVSGQGAFGLINTPIRSGKVKLRLKFDTGGDDDQSCGIVHFNEKGNGYGTFKSRGLCVWHNNAPTNRGTAVGDRKWKLKGKTVCIALDMTERHVMITNETDDHWFTFKGVMDTVWIGAAVYNNSVTLLNGWIAE